MKRLILLGVVVALLAFSASASAHVLKTDGSIGAILHIKPDDNPLSGQPTAYTLSFSDTAGNFQAQDCDCVLILEQDGQPVMTQSLKPQGSQAVGNTITFPQAGVYELIVKGRPSTPGRFQDFTLEFVVTVGGEATSGLSKPQTFPPLLVIGLASMIGLLLLSSVRLADGYNDKQ